MNIKEINYLGNILMDSINNDVKFDDKTIINIVKCISEIRGYKDYVESIKIDKKDYAIDEAAGGYNRADKELIIYVVDYSDDVGLNNLKIIQTILHELEHVEQFKICEAKDECSIKKQILSDFTKYASLYVKYKNIDFSNMGVEESKNILDIIEYYSVIEQSKKELYDFLPTERMAEIDSYKKVLELIKSEQALHDYYDMFKSTYDMENISGYIKQEEKIISPLYFIYGYLLSKNEKKFEERLLKKGTLSKISDISLNMNLKERLYYGFQISAIEYDDLVNRIIETLSDDEKHI